jgi:hypothetical protein
MHDAGLDSDTQGYKMMHPTPQSLPISALQQEPGAQDLVRSEKMSPYLELLKAHIGGQDTAPYLAALAELPLEERYVGQTCLNMKGQLIVTAIWKELLELLVACVWTVMVYIPLNVWDVPAEVPQPLIDAVMQNKTRAERLRKRNRAA